MSLPTSPDNKAIILMYHRVARPENDPWQLSVSPEYFEQQIQVLAESYHVISLDQLIDKLAANQSLNNSICITFDDGYSDNYQIGKPILEKYNCPATVFITSNYIGQNNEFWWDELEDIILNTPRLPLSLSLKSTSKSLNYTLEKEWLTEEELTKQEDWNAEEEVPTERCELYLKIWKFLMPLPNEEQQSILHEIRKWCGYSHGRKENFAMTLDELTDLANSPLFNIGIHTMSHLALTSHSEDIQREEILSCKNYLEKHCGRKINIMAFPYGNFNNTTVAVLKDLKVDVAFSTRPGIVTHLDNPHELNRFQVLNWNGQDFEERLRMVLNWRPENMEVIE